MPGPLSYADVVRLLGGEQSTLVTALDKFTGGALLGASVAAPALLGLFDAKAEFIRLSHELVREFTERRSGLSRYSRTQRLEAAHRVLVVVAFFEALDEVDLPFRFADARLSEREWARMAPGEPSPDEPLWKSLLRGKAPLPTPQQPYEDFVTELSAFYRQLSAQLQKFLTGLAVWDELPERKQNQAVSVLADLPKHAVAWHRDLLGRLATDFAEVAFWIGLAEHQGTRNPLGPDSACIAAAHGHAAVGGRHHHPLGYRAAAFLRPHDAGSATTPDPWRSAQGTRADLLEERGPDAEWPRARAAGDVFCRAAAARDAGE